MINTKSRKKDHINICKNEDIDRKQHFFDFYKFENNALPEINFQDIDCSTKFLNKKISAPIIISPITGGTKEAQKINENLALAAEKFQIPLGLGSQRIILENPKTAKTFQLRKLAPTTQILANIGAVQLNYGLKIKDCQKLIELSQADALYLHLNPLQEAIQPEGNTNFSGLLKKIEKLVKNIKTTIIIKEVGFGISKKATKQLKDIGIKYIDLAGRGGTSWALIEGKRQSKEKQLGETFADWGIPTPIAIQESCKIKGLKIIAGGGVRTGLDIAKALALGASYTSIGLPFLKAALQSPQKVVELIEKLIKELRITMFATGSKNINELKKQQCTHLTVQQKPGDYKNNK